MSYDRHPVIIATGQVLERDEIVSPVELMARAAEQCFGAAPGLRSKVQHVSVVNVLSGAGASPAQDLSLLVGLEPRRTETTAVGGNTPQWLVSRMADAIWAGTLDVALIGGGEAQRSAWTADGQGRSSGRFRERGGAASGGSAGGGSGTEGGPDGQSSAPDPIIGDDRAGFGDAEMGAGLLAPVHVYPLFESAIAHKAGRDFAAQREFLGQVMSPFTAVAASHPCAWFPNQQSPGQISELTSDNRLVAEPYPKRMCAFLGVDQAAAVLMCSFATAQEMGLADQAVFCWSGADAAEVWLPSERPDLGSLPGLRAAGSAALGAANIGIDDVSKIDFYSCFPCVVEMASDAFGIATDDSRGLTVTGGLPYFGGPGNAYTLFAIATMADLLRGSAPKPASVGSGSAGSVGAPDIGLVNGLGWYATKHSVGIYANGPSKDGWRRGDTDRQQEEIDASAIGVTTDVSTPGSYAHVDASTVHYNSSGDVTGIPVVATLADGRRVAASADESVVLSEVASKSLVGHQVHVVGSPPRYSVEP